MDDVVIILSKHEFSFKAVQQGETLETMKKHLLLH